MTVSAVTKIVSLTDRDGAKALVLQSARQHGIQYVETERDRWANKVTELSGDDVHLDPIEKLIIALERAKVVSSDDASGLHMAYLGD